MKQSNLHVRIFDLLFTTAAVAIFLGLRQLTINLQSSELAQLFMLSSIPVALLVTGFISISGRLVRYSMFAGVVACTIWGAALGYTFSTSETLSRLVDPGGYFLCLEFWMIFILLHCMMTLIILGVANAIFSVRRS